MPDQSLDQQTNDAPVQQQADTSPGDTTANTQEAATPESRESNVTRASEGETQQADVTINQDPVVGDASAGGTQTASSPVTGTSAESADDQYDDESVWSYRELQAEAKGRDLNAAGTREELVARLRADDSNSSPPPGEQDTASTTTVSGDTDIDLAGGAQPDLGAETTQADPDTSVPSGDPGEQYPEHGSIGLETTGTGQEHAAVLQGLSDERRQQQLAAARQSRESTEA